MIYYYKCAHVYSKFRRMPVFVRAGTAFIQLGDSIGPVSLNFFETRLNGQTEATA